MIKQQQANLGIDYFSLSEEEIVSRIVARKKELSDRLLILCHHYQQETLFKFADLTGDSLKLSREAAAVDDKEFIVFCGVHFMAEAADILAQDHQKVMLPHLQAGCPMADMASVKAVQHSFDELTKCDTGNGVIIPVTYVNSSADIKAFVGDKGGSVCTSSNAEKVLDWALSKGEKVFFFPDEHLGRNSAIALGIPEDEIIVWKRGELLGGNTVEQIREARIILWDGYCEVHMKFLPDQVRKLRLNEPDVKIMIHPECSNDVLSLADGYGSTEAIINAVADSPAGSKWAIGTEVNLVDRLIAKYPDKDIRLLASSSCQCTTMDCNQPVNLLWILDNLASGKIVNQITVESSVATSAKKALERMLEI